MSIMDPEDIWNECVDGTVGGDGGFAFFNALNFQSQVEGDSLIGALTSIVEDEAEGDAYLTRAGIFTSLRYLRLEDAARVVEECLEVMNSGASDDALEESDGVLTAKFSRVFGTEQLENLLESLLRSQPGDFLLGEGNFGD